MDAHVIEQVKAKAAATTFDVEDWSDEEGQKVRQQIAALEARKHDQVAQLVDGKISADVLTRVVAEFDARIDALRNSQVERAIEVQTLDAVSFDLAGLEEMPLVEQRTALKIWVEKIVVHPAGRGKRFDPDLIEIQWRDLSKTRLRGVVEA